MSEHAITRRGFIAGGAGAAAIVAASGLTGCAGPTSEPRPADEAGRYATAHVYYGAYPEFSGATAYSIDGKLTKLIGDGGALPATAYGYSQVAYSANRVDHPKKNDGKGAFKDISWDDALSEIAEKVSQVGAGNIGFVHNYGPTESFYVPRLANALGSGNVYSLGSAYSCAQMDGVRRAVGAPGFTSDFENAKFVALIGFGTDDIYPARIAAFTKAKANGAHIVLVDPRLTVDGAIADDWLPINPGTQLAFVLGVASYLITNGYDTDFVASYTTGLSAWRDALKGFDSQTAAEICGIRLSDIEKVAGELLRNAPAASMSLGICPTDDLSGESAGETARAVANVNSLIGCWNQKGGALLFGGDRGLSSAANAFGSQPATAGDAKGAADHKMAFASALPAQTAIEQAIGGELQGLVIFNADPAALTAGSSAVDDALDRLDLVVVVDSFVTETAAHADYVLPATTLYESEQLPAVSEGTQPKVVPAAQVIDAVAGDARSIDQIARDLATACGAGKYFGADITDAIAARFSGTGLTAEALEKSGPSMVPGVESAYGYPSSWATESGYAQFSGTASGDNGPVWPESDPADDVLRESEEDTGLAPGDFHLICGSQSVMDKTATAEADALVDLAEDYKLDALWINASAASDLGIANGDTVRVSAGKVQAEVPAKVTSGINPKAVFLPVHYGAAGSDKAALSGFGASPYDFASFSVDDLYGEGANEKTIVTIEKVSA